jgi:hypothetical protein
MEDNIKIEREEVENTVVDWILMAYDISQSHALENIP